MFALSMERGTICWGHIDQFDACASGAIGILSSLPGDWCSLGGEKGLFGNYVEKKDKT